VFLGAMINIPASRMCLQVIKIATRLKPLLSLYGFILFNPKIMVKDKKLKGSAGHVKSMLG
jgi:hypothetical protein